MSIRNRRPRKIRVLGETFCILYPRSIPKDRHADCDVADQALRIDAKATGVKLERFIAHEWTHAILGVSGLSEILTEEQEEALAMCFEHAIPRAFILKPYE